MTSQTIKIGTRGSKLALYQAEAVKKELENLDSTLKIELKIISTKGDEILDVALSKIGDKGLFTKELENAELSIVAQKKEMKELKSQKKDVEERIKKSLAEVYAIENALKMEEK